MGAIWDEEQAVERGIVQVSVSAQSVEWLS